MLQWIIEKNKLLNDFVWGPWSMALILGVGLYLTIRTNVLQIRKFGTAMKSTLGKIFTKS